MMNYISMLKEHGLKATFQRMHILEVIGEYGHKDIDEIYAEVIKVHPSLSLATIYKNIIIMSQSGVLSEVPVIGKKSKYEISKQDHIHLICTHCGSIEDKNIFIENKNSLDQLVISEHFNLEKKEINLYGVCSHCQNIKAS
ncbi:MAG: Fur family transcriptional regulator [Sulfurovaceae bacterium]|nr:Fur family transcriptional regulator [Sulfurovaceae bacterium]